MLAKRSLTSESALFHTHGPLPPESAHLYVLRPADARLEALIRQRGVMAVVGPHLSGKSSMLLRQWGQLGASPRWMPVYLALGELANLDEPAWYAALLDRLTRQTGVAPASLDPAAAPALAWMHAVRAALKRLPRHKTLVLLLDEADAVPPAFNADFFANLRAHAEDRTLERLAIVLAGSHFASAASEDSASPFPPERTVYITDADLEALTYLIAQLGTETRQIASDVPERIYEWTEGDVYLTHVLCAALDRAVPTGGLLLDDVDRAVRRDLFEDASFDRLWQAITENAAVRDLIDTLLDHQETVRFALAHPATRQAWLAGAVRADALGNCVLRSLVHESVLFALRRNGARHVAREHSELGRTSRAALLRDRYRLDHVVHPGKTSYLFRGTDMHTGEMVAIKQLTVSRDADEIAWQRFQREAEVLTSLDHPNIVRLRDTFRDTDFEYIVMEYIYGGSLFDRLKREGRLPLGEAVSIAAQLAGALDHAHARGIVHRDVKPSNVMLAADCVPRLADFGVARLVTVSGVTRPRTRIGTAPYLSPEACLGEPIDARGDIWSLGIVLYEMLAGAVPFTGRTDVRIARAILDHPLPDLRATRPDAPDALTALLDVMLAKNPADRIASARIAEDHLRALASEIGGC